MYPQTCSSVDIVTKNNAEATCTYSSLTLSDRCKKRFVDAEPKEFREITGKIRKGETLSDIFKKYELDLADLFSLREASASIHKLRNVQVDQPYRIRLDGNSQINSFTYWIDEDTILNIRCSEEGFCAEKIPVPYEKGIEHIGGIIKDNLISSLGRGKEPLMLAIDLSELKKN